jgi:FKBP-type peptidyl-prolyl cis-trans isomerase FkpA
MKRPQWILRQAVGRCCAVAALAGNLFAGGAAAAEDKTGVPALLQFAEQYNEQNGRQVVPAAPEKPTGKVQAPPVAASGGKKTPAPALRWQTKEAELQRQRVTINQLEQKIGQLQKSAAEKNAQPAPAPLPDMKGLSQLAQGLRQALAITPREQQAMATLRQGQQQTQRAEQATRELQNHNALLQKQLGALQAQLTEDKTLASKEAGKAVALLNGQLQALKEDNISLQAHLATARKDFQVLSASSENAKVQLKSAKEQSEQQHQQQDELQRQRLSLQTEVDNQLSTLAALRKELAALQARAPAQITPKSLEKPAGRQDYAAGVSLGEEILQMQAERQRWGVNTDKQTILAGIVDTFAGQRQLGDDELNQALIASESQVSKAREKTIAEQAKKGETYLAAFKKDKRVKSTAAGAWYRIDYAGDAAIPAEASLDVVVKEMLTNGTVIQDMEANGAVLTQTLDKFPPLFQEALKTLRNHGSLTLVVPPELAYGDKGYPPKVPPNATMVYTLRVAEVYPQNSGQKPSQPVNTEKTAG